MGNFRALFSRGRLLISVVKVWGKIFPNWKDKLLYFRYFEINGIFFSFKTKSSILQGYRVLFLWDIRNKSRSCVFLLLHFAPHLVESDIKPRLSLISVGESKKKIAFGREIRSVTSKIFPRNTRHGIFSLLEKGCELRFCISQRDAVISA